MRVRNWLIITVLTLFLASSSQPWCGIFCVWWSLFIVFFYCAEESTGIVTPEDLELNQQLNELGLPLSFQSKKEVCVQINYFG